MTKYQVVPSRVYRHTSGQCASIHGSVPWRNDIEKAEWTIENSGFTVLNPLTSQYGIGRKPWATREEAQAFADTHTPSRIGLGD